MRHLFLTSLCLCGLPFSVFAQQKAQVLRGDLEFRVKVTGTVAAEDVFRLKSAIEGRVEMVEASTYTWVKSNHVIGLVASKEFSAILDASATTPKEMLRQRWQKMYKAAKIQCPATCFILKSFIRPKQFVKPQEILIEAAKRLVLVGHIDPDGAFWVERGDILDFWPLDAPEKKQRVKIDRFDSDPHYKGGRFGGSFKLPLDPELYLDPGTPWEGITVPRLRKDVLMVPTAAIIHYEGASYLPVLISTGLTTTDETELVSGAERGRPILILDDSRLGKATRHKFDIDELPIATKAVPEPAPRPAPPSPGAPPPAKEPSLSAGTPSARPAPAPAPQPQKKETGERDPSWGPDPYEE